MSAVDDGPRLLTFELADIGRLAVDAERARYARNEARKVRQAKAREFFEEVCEDRYHPDFTTFTAEAHDAYLKAARALNTGVRRVRRAVAKYDAANAALRALDTKGKES